MNNLARVVKEIDGVEFYTDSTTGKSGVSQSGLAVLCGVDEKSVRNAVNSIRTLKPYRSLEHLVDKLSNELWKTETGLVLISDLLALDIIRYYYRQGKCTEIGCTIIGMPMLPGKSANVLSKKKPQQSKRPENRIQMRLKIELNALIEVPTESGRIDLLSSTEIIEVKEVKSWKSGIGQLLVYGAYYPSHIKRLHLFRHLQNLNFMLQ